MFVNIVFKVLLWVQDLEPSSALKRNSSSNIFNGEGKDEPDNGTVINHNGVVKVGPATPIFKFESINNNEERMCKSQHLIDSKVLDKSFLIEDPLVFIRDGMEAVIEDTVTKRFRANSLASWNLLTRTQENFYYVNFKLTLIWAIGFILRYLLFLPFRILVMLLGLSWLITNSYILSLLPNGYLKARLKRVVMIMTMRILSKSITSVIKFHNKENKARNGGICVANHTTPIDIIILSTDNCYTFIGQQHQGFFGLMQRILSNASPQIWFERSEAVDRDAVMLRIQKHANNLDNAPVLIFPEGTCINNTSVMMFHKGCFNTGATIYPVAIKYNSIFGDAFWNSSQQSFFKYVIMIMTSWAIVCDVWYLPSMDKEKEESDIDFACRVKRAIAKKGGFVNLDWDGALKRVMVVDQWKKNQQFLYSKERLRL